MLIVIGAGTVLLFVGDSSILLEILLLVLLLFKF